MVYAIKAEIVDPRERTFTFTAHKTMHGGRLIAEGDTVFVFSQQMFLMLDRIRWVVAMRS
jgi:hypothetical protein